MDFRITSSHIRHFYFSLQFCSPSSSMPTLKIVTFGSVAGCIKPHDSLHRLPASEPLQSSWLNVIFHGNVPTSVETFLFIYMKLFKDEFFINLLQHQEGFAERLHLIKGSVSSVRGNDRSSEAESCK
ncbi:hypothetical protein ILYODFUR_038261 [Ilyodon furcidens]|uniref:Uncharacterized protein n=1 Tax=Ilyodon furcidens TaxID=33524 RepID=A0ABV0TT92_9TELE